MENQPHAENEIYKIYVKFWRGGMSDYKYKAFKEDTRKRFENVLPISQGMAEARILQIKITKDE